MVSGIDVKAKALRIRRNKPTFQKLFLDEVKASLPSSADEGDAATIETAAPAEHYFLSGALFSPKGTVWVQERWFPETSVAYEGVSTELVP